MKVLLVFLMYFALTGCGSIAEDVLIIDEEDPRPHKGQGIYDELLPHVISFFEYAYNKHLGDIPVVIDNIRGDYSGTCTQWNEWNGQSAYKEVVIDLDFYQTAKNGPNSYESIEQVVWHELGHCVLNIYDHDDTMMKNPLQCKNSIMHSQSFSDTQIEDCYLVYKNHYIEDLFYNKAGIPKN